MLNYRFWYWYKRLERGDDPGGDASRKAITWQHHTDDMTRNASKNAENLLEHDADLRKALIVAARWHDRGKRRVLWQRSIGRPDDLSGVWYAKSDPKWPVTLIRTGYRHEFGSLVDIHAEAELKLELQSLPELVQQVVLHLIAVHHGYGRPHFPSDRSFDPDPRGLDTLAIAQDVPIRLASLQRRFGRWGLAFLESLLGQTQGEMIDILGAQFESLLHGARMS